MLLVLAGCLYNPLVLIGHKHKHISLIVQKIHSASKWGPMLINSFFFSFQDQKDLLNLPLCKAMIF